MKPRHYAIKNNEVVCYIDIAPFSPQKMDEFCKEKGYDGWFELNEEAALILLGL